MNDEPHEFEPVVICANCDNSYEDCDCSETEPEETDECEICGMMEDADVHDLEQEEE